MPTLGANKHAGHFEAQSPLRGGDSRDKCNEDDVKHSTLFQPSPRVLPTGGKWLGQEILSFIMQILRNSHLQLACPVYLLFVRICNRTQDRIVMKLVFASLYGVLFVLGVAGIAKAIPVYFTQEWGILMTLVI